jgi:CHAD domain-containing protein
MSARAEKLFLERIERFRELSSDLARKLDSENVRRLRVLTRRLRAHLWLLRRVSPKVKVKSCRRHLKRLGRVLGKYRTYDVAAHDASEFGLFTQNILRNRAKAAEKVHIELAAVKRAEVLNHLMRVRAKTQQVEDGAYIPILEDLQSQVIELRKKAHPSRADLHNIRIRIKKIRYLLEILGSDARDLKHAQSSLGKLHDIQVLKQLEGATQKMRKEEMKATRKARNVLRLSLQRTDTEIRHLLGKPDRRVRHLSTR